MKIVSAKKQHGHVLADLSALVAQSQEHNQRDRMLGYVHRSQMISTARRLYRLAYENKSQMLSAKVVIKSVICHVSSLRLKA